MASGESSDNPPSKSDFHQVDPGFECLERPITYEEASSMRHLLFCDTLKTFSDDWDHQAFGFRDENQTFGLVQTRSGPCGVLAAIQGHLIKELLYSTPNTWKLKPNLEQRTNALIKAITKIMFKAKSSYGVFWVVRGSELVLHDKTLVSRDGLLEYLLIKHFADKLKFEEFLKSIMHKLTINKNRTCVKLLYSLMLTRGLDNIQNEIDEDATQLIGNDGFCSQELINLLLVGRAITNVFDGRRDFGEFVFRGIEEQPQVGFLHGFGSRNDSEVRIFYKNPTHPIWIVHTYNHYNVLFELEKNILTFADPGDTFKINHYDQYGKDTSHSCITYDVELSENAEIQDEDLTLVPVVKCILTR